jgi:uncharacterized protein
LFREMRRKEKKMPEAGAIKILQEGEFGTLATMGPDGYPYAVVVNYVLHENAIYFHTAHEGHKLSNIAFCERVCFSVVGYHKLLADKFDTEYDSVVVFGTAHRVEDEAEKKNAYMWLVEKYSRAYRVQGTEHIAQASETASVYQIQIEHMTGKIGR